MIRGKIAVFISEYFDIILSAGLETVRRMLIIAFAVSYYWIRLRS